MMTIREAVKWGAKRLRDNNVDNADHDSFELLSAINGMTRTFYLVNGDSMLSEENFLLYEEYIDKRAAHVPLQHILGKAYFYGYEFEVNEDVLIPRPDTEVLVEEVIEIAKNKEDINILDIGTGSGAITVSLAKYLENAKITSVDISEIALEIGRKNAILNEVDDRITFVKSDLFTNINKEMKFDIIVSNPPYIKREVIDTLDKQVKDFEPYNALEGGIDGLDFYRAITKEAKNFIKEGGTLAYEVGHDQSEDVSKLMKMYGYTNIYTRKDLQQIDRVVIGNIL